MSFAEKYGNKNSGSGFVARLIYERALVYDLRFPDNAFFIIEVKSELHKQFKEMLESIEIIDLRDYGNILYSGYGEPSDEIKDELHKKYGMYS